MTNPTVAINLLPHLLTTVIAFGVTGHTYSHVPHPVQSVSSILIPSPITTRIAWTSHRSIHAKQPQFFAKQWRFSATARMSLRSIASKSSDSSLADSATREVFKTPTAVPTVSPKENRLFLKNSLRLKFTSCL